MPKLTVLLPASWTHALLSSVLVSPHQHTSYTSTYRTPSSPLPVRFESPAWCRSHEFFKCKSEGHRAARLLPHVLTNTGLIKLERHSDKTSCSFFWLCSFLAHSSLGLSLTALLVSRSQLFWLLAHRPLAVSLTLPPPSLAFFSRTQLSCCLAHPAATLSCFLFSHTALLLSCFSLPFSTTASNSNDLTCKILTLRRHKAASQPELAFTLPK